MVAIFVYVTWRFEMAFGTSAILALIHDVLISVGTYILLGHQVNASMIAAVFMVVGYSINDTIIIFDRIREEFTNSPHLSLRATINHSIIATLSRTLLTSFSTLLAALPLYFWGVGIVRDFSLLFIVGIGVGTFSSIFIACPFLLTYCRGEKGQLKKLAKISPSGS
jgi:SecD/SecF fusion protein